MLGFAMHSSCVTEFLHFVVCSAFSCIHNVSIVFEACAFSSAAPQIWNHIPTAIRFSPSLDSFKRHLKTHYFASP